MSLSDRLHQAARERASAAAAGTTIAEVRRREPGGLRPESDVPLPEVMIVLQAHIPVTAVDPDPGSEPQSVCPTCGRTGELGVLDLHRRSADWSCVACGTMWRVTLPLGMPAPFR